MCFLYPKCSFVCVTFTRTFLCPTPTLFDSFHRQIKISIWIFYYTLLLLSSLCRIAVRESASFAFEFLFLFLDLNGNVGWDVDACTPLLYRLEFGRDLSSHRGDVQHTHKKVMKKKEMNNNNKKNMNRSINHSKMRIENSWFFCVQAQHSVQATALKNETSLSLILKRDIYNSNNNNNNNK